MNKIQIIENYVRSLPQNYTAHGFDHVDRVRNWALKITQAEKFDNLEMIEAAALLHDIGRTVPPQKGKTHGKIGASMARKFLDEKSLFSPKEREIICEAVQYHSSIHQINNRILDVLRDADILDLSGAIGILRAAAAEHNKSIFDPKTIKGETWQMSNEYFNRNYKGKFGTWTTIPDQINFQISCFDNLKTDFAKKLAKPMVEYMRKFLLEIECEANLSKE